MTTFASLESTTLQKEVVVGLYNQSFPKIGNVVAFSPENGTMRM